MKVFRIFAAFTALLLLFSACEGAPAQTNVSETAPAPQTAQTSEKTEERSYPTISHPTTRAMVDALPIASADMTEDELRKLCVDYMLLQVGVIWTPKFTSVYPYESAGSADGNGNLTVVAGTRYSGVPYCKAAGSLDNFLDYYDEETGILDNSSFKNNFGDIIGNNCGTSVYWAWARVSSTITYYGTRMMVPAHGCYPLGPYTYDTTIDTYRECTTSEICQKNGREVMFESYALCKPASGLTHDVFKGTTDTFLGHARMVVEPAHVVRDASGAINGEESYLVCAEQGSSQVRRDTEDGSAMQIGGYMTRFTFNNLFDTNYVPVEIAELTGRSPVQKAEVSLDLEGKAASLDDFAAANAVSNYAINRLEAVFTDANGAVVKTSSCNGSCKTGEQYTLAIKKLFSRASVSRALKKGETYTVTISARLGNGETLTAYEGEFVF